MSHATQAEVLQLLDDYRTYCALASSGKGFVPSLPWQSFLFMRGMNPRNPLYHGGRDSVPVYSHDERVPRRASPRPSQPVDNSVLMTLKSDVVEAKRIATHAEHVALRTQRDLVIYKQNQLKRAQTYLPGEANARMRSLIYEWSAGKCLRCRITMTLDDGLPNSCEIDEVLPRAQGGNRTWDNIQALCRQCNGERGDAAQRGVNVALSWDFRQGHPTFIAACEREQRAYERRCIAQKDDYPLFS
jgi:5-methylcytosine-specific restriction endonuclease McrA